ncbi:hypothetical protein ABZW96_00665 [Nocardia sp. NPDC004168]|uniref:hypothetical protein n=1 Tax=unclassified Nocardia TaxID=2637762 RepID=UPI0033A67426
MRRRDAVGTSGDHQGRHGEGARVETGHQAHQHGAVADAAASVYLLVPSRHLDLENPTVARHVARRTIAPW